jgi:heptosyltransferase-1
VRGVIRVDARCASGDRMRVVLTSADFLNHSIYAAKPMRRILLVKTSSLGDVVHNFPVASDIAAAFPGCEIAWAVEEGFAALPRLHPAVSRVIPVALRRWRRSWWRSGTRREIAAFASELRSVRYDAVIDTQGLLKSAIVSRLAHGVRYGLDWRSSREPLAMFYDRTCRVPRSAQAVERNRTLAALALSYPLRARIDYGIAPEAHSRILREPYAVLVHATSAEAKLWPEQYWVALGNRLRSAGLRSLLPWGTALEQRRSERLSRSIEDAMIMPRLPLGDVTSVLADARYVVGVDTGLTHLAGTLGTPTIGVYVATDPKLTGLYGCARAANVGGRGLTPTADDVAREIERLGAVS